MSPDDERGPRLLDQARRHYSAGLDCLGASDLDRARLHFDAARTATSIASVELAVEAEKNADWRVQELVAIAQGQAPGVSR